MDYFPTLSRVDSERFQVEFFTNERSLKERLQLYFIKNQRSSLRIRILNLFLKTVTCILYFVRVVMENTDQCYTFSEGNWTDRSSLSIGNNTDGPIENRIKWECIAWVRREDAFYYVQVVLAIISLIQTILMTVLSYKGNILQQLLKWSFIIEMITTVPWIVTLCSPKLKPLYIPVFLNLWLAKSILEHMLNDIQRVINKTTSPISHQLTVLLSTIITIFAISACGIHDLQRGSEKKFELFTSLWFVVVTFSTVGYGDITPDIWPSQLYIMIMICVSLAVLPMQLEKLAYTFNERKRKGGSYSRHRAQTEKHVVVCATHLVTDTVMDFLNEFYAHPKLQEYYVVLLSPAEMEESLKIILQIPIWAQRVIYIKGSALKDSDLQRCRMSHAEGCFILASRHHQDRTAADEHTILRSWAIRDHSPTVEQYVQLFRPENKFHVKFAKHVVCEDEFKYALLANNCLCPGTSSLVTLLLHTSRGDEGNCAVDEWQRLYGWCSGNEIYEIKLNKSDFFKDYCGKSFSYASFNAHKKYGVCLIAVQSESSRLQLNPGPHYNLQEGDTLFYLSITKEEHSSLRQKDNQADEGIATMMAGVGMVASGVAGSATVKLATGKSEQTKLKSSAGSFHATATQGEQSSNSLSPNSNNNSTRRPSIAAVAEQVEDNETPELNPLVLTREAETDTPSIESPSQIPYLDVLDSPEVQLDPLWSSHSSGSVTVNLPPVAPYIGKGFHLCHVMTIPRPLCCLQLAKACKHCKHEHAKEYSWKNRAVIIASDMTSNGLYNFILPLRSQCLRQSELRPIVLFLEHEPERHFKETIRHFPMVYWITGSIDRLDDWLRAGVNYADNMVVVNKESSNSIDDDYLSDCNTIVAVQTLFRLFPGANIITELSQSSNMRFMQFRADDLYALQLSKLEKEVRRQGSHMSYMFRLPFSAGNVFSASMLDTLLYQAFVKEYLITIVRLMCGIDQEKGSGFLTCINIGEEEKWLKTYGRLYQKLCSNNGAIPIGIYRTQKSGSDSQDFSTTVDMDGSTDSASPESGNEKEEISNLVKGCMRALNLPPDDYNSKQSSKEREVSYVIINPAYDLELNDGDIVYVLRPASKRHTDRMERIPMDRFPHSASNPNFDVGPADDADDEEDESSDLLNLNQNNSNNHRHGNGGYHYSRKSPRRSTTKL